MIFNVKVSTIFECSLERAFRTPMLCDVSKVHTGYGFMPRVIFVTDDGNWGKPGSTKKIYVAKSISQKGGFASVDRILERRENEYWRIQVDDFQSWMLGFYKFIGEWKVTQLEEGRILIEYNYALYAKEAFLYPLNWLFAISFWKIYMKRVLGNIKEMAYNEDEYLYD